jgi:hypothetical protein
MPTPTKTASHFHGNENARGEHTGCEQYAKRDGSGQRHCAPNFLEFVQYVLVFAVFHPITIVPWIAM